MVLAGLHFRTMVSRTSFRRSAARHNKSWRRCQLDRCPCCSPRQRHRCCCCCAVLLCCREQRQASRRAGRPHPCRRQVKRIGQRLARRARCARCTGHRAGRRLLPLHRLQRRAAPIRPLAAAAEAGQGPAGAPGMPCVPNRRHPLVHHWQPFLAAAAAAGKAAAGPQLCVHVACPGEQANADGHHQEGDGEEEQRVALEAACSSREGWWGL